MAVRICPHCKTEVSASNVAAYSFGVDCPKCGVKLEVAAGTRMIATLCGLAAGAVAWRLSSDSVGDLGSVLPTLYAFLAFGVVSPLVLMFSANLRNAPVIPVYVPTDHHDSAGHGSAKNDNGHAGAGHH